MYTITTRTPTPDEQKCIDSPGAEAIVSCGCGIILFVILPSIAIGGFTALLRSIFKDDAIKIGLISASIIALLTLIVFLFSFVPHMVRKRRKTLKDSQEQTIEDIHVTNPRVVEISLINDNEPILAFEIGDNKILFLQGQWLRSGSIYGVEPLSEEQSEDEALDDFINGLPEPNSFPSNKFTVTRFPNSKIVTGIRVSGSYIKPEAVIEALEPEYEFGDSELFEGSLDQLADVLAREHIQRKKRNSIEN